MCNLNRNISSNTITGYKIAYHKPCTKTYKSIATGIVYKQGEDITIPKSRIPKQKYKLYNNEFLYIPAYGFRREMIGRTAVFKKKEDAIKEYNFLLNLLYNNQKYQAKSFDENVSVFKVKLYKDIMIGSYNSYTVYAGKRILFIKDILKKNGGENGKQKRSL